MLNSFSSKKNNLPADSNHILNATLFLHQPMNRIQCCDTCPDQVPSQLCTEMALSLFVCRNVRICLFINSKKIDRKNDFVTIVQQLANA